MRCSGLAQSCGAVPPISQRPLRRSTTFRGQQPCLWSGCPDHRLALGLPRAGWPGNYPSPKTLSFPKAQRLQVFPVPWLRAFFSPHDPGFPQGQATQVFPSPDGSELSFRRMARGFPSASWLKVFPLPLAPDSSLPEGPDLSFAGWRRALPRPEASKLPIAGGPGFPPNRVARSFLLAYGAGLLLARRLGFALCRVARGFPLTGGSGFPLRRLPSRW